MKNSQKIILGLIIFLSFTLRLYRLDYPLLDWHAFRQADTASVTREFLNHSYPIWEPHYQDLSNIQSGQDNLDGYRMVEFPLINYFTASILRIFPSWDLVITSRILAALFSALSTYLIFALLQKWQKNSTLSLLAAGFFALIPFGIYFGRSILPEPYQITFCLLSLYFFTLYLGKKTWYYFLTTLLAIAIALLLKPTSAFIGPVLLVLAWQKHSWRALRQIDLYLLAILSILPFLWWRQHILAYPSGIPASDWLYNSNDIRLRPAWWRWLFYERLAKTWLGFGAIIFFFCGLLPQNLWQNSQKIKRTFFSLFSQFDILSYIFLTSFFAYLIIFATGNVQHDYYQVILLPAVAIIFARGVIWFYHFFCPKIKHFWTLFIIVFILSLSWLIAWTLNQGKFNVNNWPQARIGAIADQLLPPDALVIAPAFGDTSFLFATGRTGWPIGFEIEEKIALGAQFYITTNQDDEFHQLASIYQIIYQDENGSIIDLSSPLDLESSL